MMAESCESVLPLSHSPWEEVWWVAGGVTGPTSPGGEALPLWASGPVVTARFESHLGAGWGIPGSHLALGEARP